jgi:hypothetical protein
MESTPNVAEEMPTRSLMAPEVLDLGEAAVAVRALFLRHAVSSMGRRSPPYELTATREVKLA